MAILLQKRLDHIDSQILWGTVAAKNHIVRSTDASNAFAGANSLNTSLYICIDTQYREWCKEKFNIDIPLNYVLSVQKVVQGHPEISDCRQHIWIEH